MNNFGLLKGNLSSFTISNPTSYRNEVNMSPEEWNEKLPQGYSIPDEVQEESIPVSSTAISSARYVPETDSMKIAYKSNPDKEYTFKAGGEQGIKEWVSAPSKGRITEEWRDTHYDPDWRNH